jgi:hypothetical protein
MSSYNGFVDMGFNGEFGRFYYDEKTEEISEERDYKYLVKPSTDSSIILVEVMRNRWHKGLDVITGENK